jgi:hypothetical protein
MLMALYAVEVAEPDIDRGELVPWWSLGYDMPADDPSVAYPVELTGVRSAGPGGNVEEGLAD